MSNKPQLDDLALFSEVVKNRSFATTARALGVSKALVSKRVAVLESQLQVRLLHRTTRTVSLTEQGEIVLQWASRILEDVDQMGEAVSNTRTEPHGLLRLCSSSGFGRNCVAPALSALALKYPGLEIEFELLDRPVDLISEGFHLDLRIGDVTEPNLFSRRIATNRRVMCASPGYLKEYGTPATLSDLAHHRCIVIRERDYHFGHWALSGPNGLEDIRIKGPLSANNGEIVHQWAINGHGIILRSYWDVGRSIERGDLIHLFPDYYQEAAVWAVTPSRLSSSAKLRVCVTFIEDFLRGIKHLLG